MHRAPGAVAEAAAQQAGDHHGDEQVEPRRRRGPSTAGGSRSGTARTRRATPMCGKGSRIVVTMWTASSATREHRDRPMHRCHRVAGRPPGRQPRSSPMPSTTLAVSRTVVVAPGRASRTKRPTGRAPGCRDHATRSSRPAADDGDRAVAADQACREAALGRATPRGVAEHDRRGAGGVRVDAGRRRRRWPCASATPAGRPVRGSMM